MYTTSDFRNGLKVEMDGEPWVVVEFQHVKPGKGGAFVRTRLKHLRTGQVLDKTFKSGEKFNQPDLEERSMQYLYKDAESYHFMDTNNYEQVRISYEQVGDARKFLSENDVINTLFYKGEPISIDLPTFVVMKIIKCEPGVRGDTATGATKPAELETGAIVYVPLFVEEGESIKIDTRTEKYIERA
ncbi:elongation factor P [bacterium]|nr:elongation factor P [candidate division CSSED10-310 bacterium]